MEHCKTCGLNVRGTDTCTVARVQLKELGYQRVPFGNETGIYRYLMTDRCPECQVVRGGYHHFGCEVEACPRCGGRASLVKCGCLVAEYH